MLRPIIIASALIGMITAPASAQFFSIDAGTDGFNMHVSNYFPVPALPIVVAPEPVAVPVIVPLRPGVVMDAPRRHRKAVKKARKAYYREMQRSASYGYGFPFVVVYRDDDDDDDYEEYLEDMHKWRKKQKKAYKKWKKHQRKHHGRRHHHDDDDD